MGDPRRFGPPDLRSGLQRDSEASSPTWAMGGVQLRAGIAPLEAPKRIVVRSVAADVD